MPRRPWPRLAREAVRRLVVGAPGGMQRGVELSRHHEESGDRGTVVRPRDHGAPAIRPAAPPSAREVAIAARTDGPALYEVAARRGRGWTPGTTLALQRLAGNRAVAARLARRRVLGPGGAPGSDREGIESEEPSAIRATGVPEMADEASSLDLVRTNDAGPVFRPTTLQRDPVRRTSTALAVAAYRTAVTARQDDGRHAHRIVVQRHSSWEHKLLGDVDPKTLQVITNANAYAGKPWHEKKLGIGGKPLAADTAAATHALQQQLETLAAWQAAPPSPGVASWQGMTIVTVKLDDGDAVAATLGEVNTLADYYGSLDQLKRGKKETVSRILQTVRRQSWVKLHEVLGHIDPDVAKGIKEPTFEGALTQSGQALDLAFQKLTMDGRNKGSETYLSNVARNACHFAPQSWYRWKEYHERARAKAKQAHGAKNKAVGKANTSLGNVSADLLNEAILENGFGDHYLQDSFASGHLINKTLVMQWFIDWMGTMSGPEAAVSRATGTDQSKGAAYLGDWDRLKRMQSGVQTKLAGLDLYGKPEGGRANDPQSAEEETTKAGRIARTGLSGPNPDQAYGDYQAMLNNAAVQMAAGDLHNHFCKAGLTVLAGWTPVGKVFGDDNMLAGGEGIEFSANTAKMSREAIADIAEGKPAKPTSEIMARFPDTVDLGGGDVVSLKEWHTGGKLRAFCESSIFPGVYYRALGRVPTALGGAVSQDAPGGTKVTEDPVDRLRRSIPGPGDVWRAITEAAAAIDRRVPGPLRPFWNGGRWLLERGIGAAGSAWDFGKGIVRRGIEAAGSAWDLAKGVASSGWELGRRAVGVGAEAATDAWDAGRSLVGEAVDAGTGVWESAGDLAGSASGQVKETLGEGAGAVIAELSAAAARVQGLAEELPAVRDQLESALEQAKGAMPEPATPEAGEAPPPVPTAAPVGAGAGGMEGDAAGPF